MQMRERRWQLALIICSLGVMLWCGMVGRADDMKTIYDYNQPDSKTSFHPNPRVAGTPFDNQAQLIQGTFFPYEKFSFRLESIKANGTNNGRITKNTTVISIDIDVKMNTYDKYYRPRFKMKKLQFIVMHVNGSVIKILGNGRNLFAENLDALSLSAHSLNEWLGRPRDIDVDLANIKDALPLKLGFYFPTENPDVGTMYYDLGYFAAGESILKPTIDATLTKDSVKITGKGTSGNLVTNSVTNKTIPVDQNGVYQFTLEKGKLADYLTHNDRVTVTESNDTGDTGIAELKKLSIAAIEQDPTFDLEDSLKLGGAGDEPDLDQVTNFIVDQLKLRTGEAATAKFAIDYGVISQAELVKSIKAFNDNQFPEIKIPIYATEPGYMQSNTLNVKVTHDAQGLAFGQTMTTLDFGQHEVPMVSKTFYPIKSWSIIVHDHRKNKSAWNIKARLGSATSKSAADSLAGYLWYQAPNQTDKIRLSDTDVQIFHQSADTKNADTVIPFKSESTSQTADSGLHQLFVQAGPKIAAGEKKVTINWTLEDAP